MRSLKGDLLAALSELVWLLPANIVGRLQRRARTEPVGPSRTGTILKPGLLLQRKARTEPARPGKSWQSRVLVDAYNVGRGQSLLGLRASWKCSFFAGTSSTSVDDLCNAQTDLLPIVGELKA